MKPAPRILSQHRLTRLARWVQAMLAWLTLVLFSETARITRRYLRQRYGFASLDDLERLVRTLAVARAIEIAGVTRRRARLPRNAAPAGFRRRIDRCARMRAIAGKCFRKAVKHRDAAMRIELLRAALADIDAFARRVLVARMQRGLARVCAVVLVRPPAQPLAGLVPAAPVGADSS